MYFKDQSLQYRETIGYGGFFSPQHCSIFPTTIVHCLLLWPSYKMGNILRMERVFPRPQNEGWEDCRSVSHRQTVT